MCFETADILLPKGNMEKFAVIACDQFTSEPEYWNGVKEFTKGYPTALDLILPEIYLKQDNSAQIEKIHNNMNSYLKGDFFENIEDSFILVKRLQSDGVLRTGIIGKIDLKEYSYLDNGTGAVRSTEKTVLERIPPRAAIRKGAPIELPHVLLLFDDPDNTVLGELEKDEKSLPELYDFELYGGSGHLTGHRVTGDKAKGVKDALSAISDKNNGLLFLVGDGNHSLAAAKSIYEQTGSEKDRYALVEIVNVHSPAINFEPIYRVCFGVEPQAFIAEFKEYCGGAYRHEFKCVYAGGEQIITVNSDYRLPVAALQDFLDKKKKDVKVDYIHGVTSAENIARRDKCNLAFIFKGMSKDELFEAVKAGGSLPRKTFSMGHAADKRFYLEARRIG